MRWQSLRWTLSRFLVVLVLGGVHAAPAHAEADRVHVVVQMARIECFRTQEYSDRIYLSVAPSPTQETDPIQGRTVVTRAPSGTTGSFPVSRQKLPNSIHAEPPLILLDAVMPDARSYYLSVELLKQFSPVPRSLGRWPAVPIPSTGAESQTVTLRAEGRPNYFYTVVLRIFRQRVWRRVGGQITTPPVLAALPDGRLELFGRGIDQVLYHRRQNSPGSLEWSDWTPLAGQLSPNPPAVGTHLDGRLEVFTRGTDGRLWRSKQLVAGGTTWGAWQSWPEQVTGDPVVGRTPDGRLHLFCRGTMNELIYRWMYSPNDRLWTDWRHLGGVLPGGIAVGNRLDGRLEVFHRGTDNRLYHMWQLAPNSHDPGWSNWSPLGGAVSGDPTAVRADDGRLHVFIRGGNGRLWHTRQQSATSDAWVALRDVGADYDDVAPEVSSRIAVGRNPNGALDILCLDVFGSVRVRRFLPLPGAFSFWGDLGGTWLFGPVVAPLPDGRLEAYVLDGEGLPFRVRQAAPGDWGSNHIPF